MAPNVTLHFFAANDINGDVLHEITDEDTFFRDLTLSLERDGLGSADLLLSRMIGFAGFASGTFQPEVFVRFLVSSYSDTVYYPWAMSLNKRQQVVIHKDEKGAEVFRFGGPGPKFLMQRHALGIHSNMAGDWNVDLTNGVWRWTANATVGQILNRILEEDQARPDPSLPFMDTTFTASHDSNGVAWADSNVAEDELFEIPIGTDYLTILHDMDDLVEISSSIDLGTVASPAYDLNVWQGRGDDNMGSAFGAGVCLLKEGENITNDSLTVEGQNLRKASHVIVEGKDGQWVVAERAGFSPGDYVKYEKIEYTRSSSDYWLEKAGLRWLKRQDIGEREYSVQIIPGTSDATGLYFPAPDRVLWLDNLVSLDSSADGSSHSELDVDPGDEQLVTGIELKLGVAGSDASADAKAKSWDIKVKLNEERAGIAEKSPSQTSGANGDSCRCRPTQPAPEIEPDDPGTALHLWEWAANALDTVDGVSTAFRFSGVPHAYGPAETAFGAGGVYGSNSAGNYQTSALTVTAGTDYVFETDILWRFDPTFRGLQVHWFSDAGGNTLISTDDFVIGPGHGTNTEYHEQVTLTAPTGAVTCRVVDPHHFAGIFLDNLQMATVSTPAVNDPDAFDYGDCPHSSRSWLPSDYIKCRLDGLAESIPGALTDLQDVDAPSPTDGQVLTWNSTDEEWEAETLPTAPVPAGVVGELLIADTGTSTPLVFADILQNEAQTDLLYGDV